MSIDKSQVELGDWVFDPIDLMDQYGEVIEIGQDVIYIEWQRHRSHPKWPHTYISEMDATGQQLHWELIKKGSKEYREMLLKRII